MTNTLGKFCGAGIAAALMVSISFASLSMTAYAASQGAQEMYRLYNPNSGEHFYTAAEAERDNLEIQGWRYEGVGWVAPMKSNTPIYRLYNNNAGDHHYTMNATERDGLVRVGWRYEGIGWYSDDSKAAPIYRQYNPHARSGAHNYTASVSERDSLIRAGWRNENVGWYGLNVSTSQRNALRQAKSYLEYSAFSYQGLIGQLEYEKYSTADATWAVDHVGADWNEQAARKAKSYLEFTPFSRDQLIGQLEYDQFTHAQAVYGVDHAGANW